MTVTPVNTPSDQDFELLSVYLDSALDSAERATLEARLAAEPTLAAELEALRRTVQIVKAAPPLMPPRNFTLDPARYRPPTPPWWVSTRWMQIVGTVGTLAAVMLIAVGGVLFSTANNAPSAASIAMQTTPMSVNATDKTSDETVAAIASTSTALASPTDALKDTDAVLAGSAATAATVNPTSSASDFAAQNGAADQQTAPSASAGVIAAPSTVPNTAVAPNSAAPAPAIAAPTRPPQALESSGGAASSAAKIAPTEPPTAIVLPTQTIQRTATIAQTATQTVTRTTVPTSIAAVSTAVLPAANQVAQPSNEQIANFTPQIFLIAGIALLVFSLMLLGLSWLRSRL
ncbi:MAG: hypothetical protein ABI947_01805 [Chloroflexota bacterium]